MNPIEMARKIEERYYQYLRTTFYFRDPDLRASFARALDAGRLSRGPYLEATPVFKRGLMPGELFADIFGEPFQDSVLRAFDPERRLYQHQEEAIRRLLSGRNVIIATGTGSGKSEGFLYPIIAPGNIIPRLVLR
jgi:ATP-dependent helicase YprA (DUF1998 family)